MKNQKPDIYRIPAVAMLIAVLFFPGCSYMMDAIEGAITERASFSIDAEYIGGDIVRITWDETDTSEGFAGYEIYMTKEPNDEFAGYTTVAAGHLELDDGSLDLPPNLPFDEVAALLVTSTNTYTHAVSALIQRGTYFYRVGIIHWDQEKASDRTLANGYTGPLSTDYINHTEIDKISGYAMVQIP